MDEQKIDRVMEAEPPKNPEKPKKRSLWSRIMDSYIMIALLTLFLLIITDYLGYWVYYVPANGAVWQTAGMYLTFTGNWIGMLLYLRFTKKNRPILGCIGTKPAGNNLKYLGLGLAMGFGLNGICILAAWLHQDIQMYFDSFRLPALLFVFVAVFIQSSAEELFCRGFMYQRLRRGHMNPWIAIVGNAALFAALHLLNPGVNILAVINILVVGIFFSLMVYYMDSLWCAMAVHAAWNYTQNIIFGLPNSGVVVPFSILKLEASTARNSIFYNVGFGIEGTVMADLVLILACVLMVLWGRKNGKKEYDPWQE